MKRYRMYRGKNREHPEGEMVLYADAEACLREREERVKELEKYQCRHPNTITNGTDYRCSSCQKDMTRGEWLELVGEG